MNSEEMNAQELNTEEMKSEDMRTEEINTEKKDNEELSEEDAICNDIIKYGKEVLISDIFRKTASQRHHIQSTLMEHTLNVCIIAVKLCREQMRKGVQLNEKDLVQAALCHDLGMIGREKKYKNSLETCKRHPQDSADIAKAIIPNLSPNADQMIRSHMWPLSKLMPESREGKLLCKADKYASMADWQYIIKNGRYAERIKANITKLFEEEGLGDPFASPKKADEKV